MSRARRRRFLFTAWALLPWPLAGAAQQAPRIWRVGFLALRRIGPLGSDFFGEFPRGMRELGYVEGRNLAIEWRSAEGHVERLPDLAADLVRLKVDVILAAGAQAVAAAQKATASIAIVMGTAGDPVGSGFVRTLARPGGNITGLSDLSSDVSPKLFEFLRSAVPGLSHVAVLVNPDNSSHVPLRESVRSAALSADIRVTFIEARTPQEIESAFTMMARQNAKGAIAAADALFNQQCRQIAELAASYRLPSISGYWQYAEAGGLMSYGQNFGDNFRRSAMYVDKIFRGARPGDLPVEQPTRVQFSVNRKTARRLGLSLPPDVLLRADQVIE